MSTPKSFECGGCCSCCGVEQRELCPQFADLEFDILVCGKCKDSARSLMTTAEGARALTRHAEDHLAQCEALGLRSLTQEAKRLARKHRLRAQAFEQRMYLA